MAVIQISRIQVRRGVADLSTPSGLPQLASGEIGWAIDQQRLWIGSGSVDEGAPAVENVEILTVPALTNILATFTASNYIYKLDEGSGGGALGATSRTIQSKLDDRVSVADFGVNSGEDVTVNLQNALQKLYVENTLESDGPVLEFPPGLFELTATIYVPPNAKLKGVGPGKTILKMMSTNTSLIQTVGSDGTSTGMNIVGKVSGVSIDGFTLEVNSEFTTTTVESLVKLDKSYDTTINNCEFVGVYDLGNTVKSIRSSAIELRYNSDDLDNSNIKITNNKFDRVSYGIHADDSVNNVLIEGNTFYNNYRGIALRETTGTTPSNYGPQNIKIENNYFDMISDEGIYAGESTSPSSGIISSHNIFRDVGKRGGADHVTPVITFISSGNISENDTFERFNEVQPTLDSNGSPDALPTITIKPIVDGSMVWQTKSPLSYPIDEYEPAPSLDRVLAVIPFVVTGNVGLEVDYILNRSDCIRTGKLTLNVNGTSGAVIIRDEFTYQGTTDGGTSFSANTTEAGGAGVVLKYLTNGPGTITLTVRTIQ